MNVRKKLLWKLSTLALAFLLIAILALAGSGTSHGAPQTEPQRTAWSQPTPNWKAAGALRTGRRLSKNPLGLFRQRDCSPLRARIVRQGRAIRTLAA